MSEELKPCPFCGDKPIELATSDGGGELYCVHCNFTWIKPWGEWNSRVDSSLNDRIKAKTYLKIIGDLDAKLKTLQDDQRKGGEDYCNLMERFDDLHNENADLTAKLKLAVEAINLTRIGLEGEVHHSKDIKTSHHCREMLQRLDSCLAKIGEQL